MICELYPCENMAVSKLTNPDKNLEIKVCEECRQKMLDQWVELL